MAFRHKKGKDAVLTAGPAWTIRERGVAARDGRGLSLVDLRYTGLNTSRSVLTMADAAGIPGPGSYKAVIEYDSQHRRSPGCFFPQDLALKGVIESAVRTGYAQATLTHMMRESQLVPLELQTLDNPSSSTKTLPLACCIAVDEE